VEGSPAVILAGLPAVFLVRRSCGGVEGLSAVILAGWPADHLLSSAFI